MELTNKKNMKSNEINSAEEKISKKNSIIRNKSIKYIYKNPPLIGLQNLGDICYMNVVIQCLSNIEQLTNYFKYDSYIKEIIKEKPDSLTTSYKHIIDKLWPSNNKHINSLNNNKYYPPREFNKKICSINPLFEENKPNDAKDFVDFMIWTLHKDLNIIKNNNNNMQNPIDIKNEQLVLQDFITKYNENNNSIISDLFYRIDKSIAKCLKCQNSFYNFQGVGSLIIPLEPVRIFKLKELQENKNNIMNEKEKKFKIDLLNKNIIDIKDCFDYNQKIEILSGNNAFHCSQCGELCDMHWQTLLYTLPQILIINLNRGKANMYKVKCQFKEILDLNNYANNGGIYELISVITHLGENDNNYGHFIAACKSPIDNQWYRYNNAMISNISDFNKDILNFGLPYILFYKRK